MQRSRVQGMVQKRVRTDAVEEVTERKAKDRCSGGGDRA